MSISRNSSKIEFANTLRGLAALTVVLGHQLGFFWGGREIVAQQSRMPILPLNQFPSPFYAAWVNPIPHISLPMVGVAVFFLVSGFVIPFSLQKVPGSIFLVGRFFRLAPTFAAATIVTIIVVSLGVVYFGVPWPYTISQVVINLFPGFRDLLWVAPIDGVVWTLEVEIKFYLLCALAAPLLARYSKLVFLIPVLLFVPSLAFWSFAAELKGPHGYGYTIPFSLAKCAQYIIFMFVGIAFHYVYMARMRVAECAAVTIFLFAMMVVLWTAARDIEHPSTAWSYVVALVIFGVSVKFRSLFRGGPVTAFLADISYPLYVCHCITGYVALRVLIEAGLANWVAQMVVLAAVILVAWRIHISVERPSHQLGRSIMARLSIPGRPAIAT